MNTLLERFCRYCRVGTQADEKSTTYPSTPGQLELGRMLAAELKALGLRDAEQDGHGIVMATIPATVQHPTPVIAWIFGTATELSFSAKACWSPSALAARITTGTSSVLPASTVGVTPVRIAAQQCDGNHPVSVGGLGIGGEQGGFTDHRLEWPNDDGGVVTAAPLGRIE